VTEYVNRVGQNLVRNSDAQVPFTIKVIDSDVVNAMALPGGFFYVNSGLILAADEEAEMAGVMAHEIAHVAACHYGREMTRRQVAAAGLDSGFIFMGGAIGYAVIRSGMGLGDSPDLPQVLPGLRGRGRLPRRRIHVPRRLRPLGLRLVLRKDSGHGEEEARDVSPRPSHTHPQTPDRIEKTQEEIRKILPSPSRSTS
jgi:beta-barrel assembly-enhancing protease